MIIISLEFLNCKKSQKTINLKKICKKNIYVTYVKIKKHVFCWNLVMVCYSYFFLKCLNLIIWILRASIMWRLHETTF